MPDPDEETIALLAEILGAEHVGGPYFSMPIIEVEVPAEDPEVPTQLALPMPRGGAA